MRRLGLACLMTATWAALASVGCNHTRATPDGGDDAANALEASSPTPETSGPTPETSGPTPEVPSDGVPAQACNRGLTPAASLNGGFQLLFRKQIAAASAWLNGSVVATRDRIAISDGSALHILDRQADEVALFNRYVSAHMSAPVADQTGTIYVVAEGAAWAFDGNGNVKWSSPVGSRGGEHDFHKTPLLSSTTLFSAELSGSVIAINKADGRRLWSAHIPGVHMPGVGLGNSVTLVMQVATRSPVLDASTGALRFELDTQRGWAVWPSGAASRYGLLRSEIVEGSGTATTVHDENGNLRFALPAPASENHTITARYVDLDGWLVVSDDQDGNVATGLRLRRFDCAGNEGPSNTVVLDAGRGYLRSVLAGADGLTYLIAARAAATGRDGFDIYAFDRGFTEIFRHRVADVGLSVSGNTAFATLSDDGVLFTVGERRGGGAEPPAFDLVAIQTPSPGIARTGWAAPPGDQGVGGWAE